MSFRNTPRRTARSSDDPAACTMAFKFSMMHSACCAASPVSALPVFGSNAVWPETNMNPLALMACEYGPMALGPFSVKITSLTTPPQGRSCKLEIRKSKSENGNENPRARNHSPAFDCCPIFHFQFSMFALLFVGRVTIAKILRHPRAIQPHAKRLSQILPGCFLDGRAQVIEPYFLAAQQRNYPRQPAAHRLLAIRVFQRDKKQRSLGRGDPPLLKRVVEHRRDDRLFGARGSSRSLHRCVIRLKKLPNAARASRLPASGFIHYDRGVVRQPF